MERSREISQKEKASDPRKEIVDQLLAIRDSVSDFPTFLPRLLSYLHDCCHNFKAGRVAAHFAAWKDLTNDRVILSDVLGASIELSANPRQHRLPDRAFKEHEYSVVHQELQKLLQKGVIMKVKYSPSQIVSGIFLLPKKDGTFRLILNLKSFNEFVTHHHFKMDSLQSIIKLVTPSCFMASIDMKDAYYSIPVKIEDRKYLRFKWADQFYEFTCLPNGLSCAPRQFTKILKPPLAALHKQGHISIAHLDDLYLQGRTYDDCVKSVIDTAFLLDKLGLVVHPEKSRFIPSQVLVILGFIINSLTMTIQLTAEKALGLKTVCIDFLRATTLSIREVASAIGRIVASFPGVMHGPLFYRHLEKDKCLALQQAKGNFDTHMTLSQPAKCELQWWRDNVMTAHNVISHVEPQHQITTDASLLGWGAEHDGLSTGGNWTHVEAKYHINYLEMLAIYLALQTFAKGWVNTHIRVLCDNTTAVNVLNHMGTSHSDSCNSLAKKIWAWCIARDILGECCPYPW